MNPIRTSITAIAMTVLVAAQFAHAADPAAVQTPIHGADVTGGSRTGPDGFVWAPQTRNQVPGDQSQTASTTAPNAKPAGPNTKKLAPGDDPGTPVAPNANGPGSIDLNGAPTAKPAR